jgi:hypothetical protein
MASGVQSAPQRQRLLRADPGIGWRIRRFLGSRGHVVGSLLGIVGILLLDAGLVHGLLAIAVIAGLYAIGYFLATRPKLTTDFATPEAKDADVIEAGLDQMLAEVERDIAPDIYEVVQGIRDAIVFTLDHVGDLQTDPDIFAVRQTALTYLPEALSKYVSLPRGYAERQQLENGKTPHDVLLEQLLVMEQKANEVAEAVIDKQSQRLVAHGRFIAERFADSKLEPSTVSVPAPAAELAPVPTSAVEREREKARVG